MEVNVVSSFKTTTACRIEATLGAGEGEVKSACKPGSGQGRPCGSHSSRRPIEASALTANGLVLQLAGGDSLAALVTDLTDTANATLPLTVGSRYEMRGYVNSTGNIIADRIDDASSGGGARDIFQAQVDARTGDVLTMLGTTVDTSTVPNNEFRDANDNPITRAAFLAAAIPGKVVKVRDDDLNGTWDKAEIEN